jgi:hypothetical protein
LASSKPCQHCCLVIRKLKIKKVIYSVGSEHPNGPGFIIQSGRTISSDHISSGRDWNRRNRR